MAGLDRVRRFRPRPAELRAGAVLAAAGGAGRLLATGVARCSRQSRGNGSGRVKHMRPRVIWTMMTIAAAWAADDRAEDRAAIRADIDGIYRAFINKDRVKVRATHADNWHGFLEGSRTMIHNIDEYMNYVGPMRGQYGMVDYKFRDFDIVFAGDAAFVTFVTDIEIKTPT